MITLITGVPGGGKTLYCVHEFLLMYQAQNRKAMEEGKELRKIFVDGIPELLIDHEPAPDINNWHEWAPDGCVIVVDEIQRHWRPDSSRTIPEAISALELHRHKGIDIILMTQHPALLHLNVRKLVGRHIHLRRTALGVYAYEWSECVTPDNAWKSAITKLKWDHPKSSFGLYKSASIHQKVKFRIPRVIWALIFSVLLIVAGFTFVGYQIYSSITGASLAVSPPEPVVQAKSVPQVSQANSVQSVPGQLASARNQNSNKSDQESELVKESKELTLRDPQLAFRPRVVGQPETAPAYDPVRVVAIMPEIVGCISDPDDCQCYTQQGTVVQMMESQCRERLHTKMFNAYKQPNSGIAQQSALIKQS